MADDVVINQGAGGDTIAADDIGGKKYQRIKLISGDDGVNDGDVSAGNPLPVELMQASTPSTVIGTVIGETLTKGTQGSTGFSVQDLKDAGRTIVNCAAAIAGVTCVTAEALIAMDVSRNGAATAPENSHSVTAGKKWRIQAITVGLRSTSAAVLAGRFALRINPSGAVSATDPIVAILSLSSGDAVIQDGNEATMPIPDGLEISGTMQWGLTQVCSAATGVVYASAIGYEY